MEFKFICPKCGGTQLEEVLKNAIVYTDIFDITINNGIANYEYGKDLIDDSETDAYQCKSCGFRLAINGDDVTDLEGLALWLKQNR